MSDPFKIEENTLPVPDAEFVGISRKDNLGKRAFAAVAKLWRPRGTSMEPAAATVSRYAMRLIDRETGKAYSAEELEGKVLGQVPGEVDLNVRKVTSLPVSAQASASVSGWYQPDAGTTLTVGSQTYTTIAGSSVGTTRGEVAQGESLVDYLANLEAAIAGTDGLNAENEDVYVSSNNGYSMTISAKEAGEAGNRIPAFSTYDGDMVSLDSDWSGKVLSGGSYAAKYVGERVLLDPQEPLNEEPYIVHEWTGEGWQRLAGEEAFEQVFGFATPAAADHAHTQDDVRMTAPDGTGYRLTVSNGGVVSSSFYLYPMLNGYVTATGIDKVHMEKLRTFFAALETAGVRANLWDGSILKKGYAGVQGTSAAPYIRSLGGKANMYLFGNPAIGNCGLMMDTDQSARAPFTGTVGARTFISCFQTGTNFQSPFTNACYYLKLTNNHTTGFAGEHLYSNNTANVINAGNGSSTSGTFTDQTVSGLTRNNPSRFAMVAQVHTNAAANTANAIKVKNRGFSLQQAATTSSASPYSVQVLEINGKADSPSTSTSVQNTIQRGHMSLAGWLLFDKALSEAEIDAVWAALDGLLPRWRYVCDGDSLMNYVLPRMLQVPEVYGSNLELMQFSVGGRTHTQAVTQLGSGTGFNASALAAASYPVIADYISTDGFDTAGETTAAAQYALIRQVWAYIRATNPAAFIIGRTVTSQGYFENDGTMEKLATLNALIRADEGNLYDKLVDNWQIAEDLKNPAVKYQHNDPALFLSDGRVHYTEYLGTKIAYATLRAIEESGAVIR